MALRNCKDCNNPFSTDAKRCPNCGAKRPAGGGGLVGKTLLWVTGLALLGVLAGGRENTAMSANPERYVLSTCREFVRASLHDPSSAEFDRPYPSPVTLPGNSFSMTLPLRAKNGFGAVRRFSVECTVRYDGRSWSLVSLRSID